MNGKELFARRFIQDCKYQMSIIKLISDWTIIVYFVIPFIFISLGFYIDLWKNTNLYWNENLPIQFILALILIFSSSGNFRTYLLSADILYLLQNKKLIYELKLNSFIVSLVLSILKLAIIFLIAMPLLMMIYNFSVSILLLLFIAVYSYKILIQTIKKFIHQDSNKSTLFLLIASLLIIDLTNMSSSYIFIGNLFLILGIIIFNIYKIKKSNYPFSKEIEIEYTEKYKFSRNILYFSKIIEKSSIRNTENSAFFWKNSDRIFKIRNKENGILELIIKSFIRNKNFSRPYINATLMTIIIIFLLPIWIKWMMIISYLFFINSWIKSSYDKILKNDFFMVVNERYDVSNIVLNRFRKYLVIPSMTLMIVIGIIASLI